MVVAVLNCTVERFIRKGFSRLANGNVPHDAVGKPKTPPGPFEVVVVSSCCLNSAVGMRIRA